MIPKHAKLAFEPITVEEAEKLIDENIEKNGGTSALVDFQTATSFVLEKLLTLYKAGNWDVEITHMRDGRTTRFKRS